MQQTAFLSLGSNISGHFGDPLTSLRQSVSRLSVYGIVLVKSSSVYRTAGVGREKQPTYYNAVVEIRSPYAPRYLLHILKKIETDFGRRRNGLNRPRPIDLDIVDASWPETGWQKRKISMATAPDAGHAAFSTYSNRRRKRPHLMLPHPEVHKRRFVLEPLLEISPHWYHRTMHCPARRLLARLPCRPRDVERTLDSLLHS